MCARRLLVLEHQADCTPAAFGGWLGECGVELEVVRPYAGDAVPLDVDGHDGLLVLGGSMGANDDRQYPWLLKEKALLRSSVRHGVPTLGICLGHQLLAVACGGRVRPNPVGRRMGVVQLDLTEQAKKDPLLCEVDVPAIAARWNADIVVGMPPSSTLLGTADGDVPHAIRVGEYAWGVQFHPEATGDVVAGWADRTTDTARAAGENDETKLAAITEAAASVRQHEFELAESTGRPLAYAFARQLAG